MNAAVSNAEVLFCYLLRAMRWRIERSGIPRARLRNLGAELADFLIPAVIASRSTLEVVRLIADRFVVNLVGHGCVGAQGVPMFSHPATACVPRRFLPNSLPTFASEAVVDRPADLDEDDGDVELDEDLVVEASALYVRWDALVRLIDFTSLRLAVYANPSLFASFAMNDPVQGEADMFVPWSPMVTTAPAQVSVTTLLMPKAYRARWTLAAPMSHGADVKTGNVSLFRRHRMIDPTTWEQHLVPFVSGNAVRGLWRDQMAASLLRLVGLKATELPSKTAHSLFAGGTIDQGADTSVIKLDVRRQAREFLPLWDLLGGVFRQQVMRGQLRVADAILVCRENAWVLAPMMGVQVEDLRRNLPSTDDLTQLRLLTRHAHRDFADADGMQMLVNTEVLLPGAQMVHAFSVLGSRNASSMLLSCMAYTIAEFRDDPFVGAGAARGLGQIAFDEYEMEGSPLPSADEYVSFVQAHKAEIRAFLLDDGSSIGDVVVTPKDVPKRASKGQRRGKANGDGGQP